MSFPKTSGRGGRAGHRPHNQLIKQVFQVLRNVTITKRKHFPLQRTLQPMYPPKVTDEQVRAVIRELAAAGAPPSGAQLRKTLAERFASRGGVTRIYRLLSIEAASDRQAAPSSISARMIELENRNLKEALRQAKQRENDHQAHWTGAALALWDRIRTLESRVSEAVQSGAIGEALRQELKTAEISAGRLEVLIRAFGPASRPINLDE